MAEPWIVSWNVDKHFMYAEGVLPKLAGRLLVITSISRHV